MSSTIRHRLIVILASLAALIPVFILVILPTPASAHTGFESSDPAEGTTVNGPLETVTLVFSAEAEPAGEGFEVLDSTGAIRIPVEQSSPDGRTWILRFDPPLAEGSIGVRWKVKAPDKHPIEGAFTFAVAPAAADAVSPDAASAEPSDPPASPPATSTPNTATPNTAEMADFVSTPSPPAGAEGLTVIGRFLSLGGIVVGLGALAFVALVMRGNTGEVMYVVHWVRRSGLVVVIGSFFELAGVLAVEGGGWGRLLSPGTFTAVTFSSFGIAVAMRMAGGLVLTAGIRDYVLPAVEASDPMMAVGELVGIGGPPGASSLPLNQPHSGNTPEPDQRADLDYQGDAVWHVTGESIGASVGSLLLLASLAFDGHTVSKGDRFLTGIINSVHVAAGSVWAGGLAMMAAVLWRRHRRGQRLRALPLALRFSVAASGALVVVAAAGLALSVIILDQVSELWSTPWGLLLMAKVLAVAVAGAAGAYNHSVLIPELAEQPESGELSNEFKRAVTVEALALTLVLALTAYLIGAAS